MHRDLDIDGVLLSPFVAYAGAAFVLMVLLRLVFRRFPLARYVANPPLAEAGLFVCLLALVIALA